MSAEERPVDQARCDAALARINEFFAGALTEGDAEEILRGLQACEPCASQLDLEAAVGELVRRSCRNDRAPEALRQKILTSITRISSAGPGGVTRVTQITVTEERVGERS